MADQLISSLNNFDNLIEVYHNDAIYLSRAFPVFLRGYADRLDNDFIILGKPWFKINCGILYLNCNEKIIGYLAYGDEKNNLLYTVDINIDEKFRNIDIYKILITNLEIIAKEKNCLAISAILYVDNIIAIRAAEESGLIEIYKQFVKKLTV
jgi:hypothetical protein